jgi:hypothetical protein
MSYIFIFQILSQGHIYKNKNGKNKAATYTSTSITNSQIIKTELKLNTDNLVIRAFITGLTGSMGCEPESVFSYSCAYHAFT